MLLFLQDRDSGQILLLPARCDGPDNNKYGGIDVAPAQGEDGPEACARTIHELFGNAETAPAELRTTLADGRAVYLAKVVDLARVAGHPSKGALFAPTASLLHEPMQPVMMWLFPFLIYGGAAK